MAHGSDVWQVFMGLKNLYHAVHAAGISDILQAGPPTEIDHDHYWDFFDCTYIEDVSTFDVLACIS